MSCGVFVVSIGCSIMKLYWFLFLCSVVGMQIALAKLAILANPGQVAVGMLKKSLNTERFGPRS